MRRINPEENANFLVLSQIILYTNKVKSILFAWLGNKDIDCLVHNKYKGIGAIAQAIQDKKYSHLILLSDFEQEKIDTYTSKLKTVTARTKRK